MKGKGSVSPQESSMLEQSLGFKTAGAPAAAWVCFLIPAIENRIQQVKKVEKKLKIVMLFPQ